MSFLSHTTNIKDRETPVCRACLARQDDNGFRSMLENNINFYYTALTKIDVTAEDSYSKMICSKCSILLTHFHAFKETCTMSDVFLRSQPTNEKDDFRTHVNLQNFTCDPIQLSIPCENGVYDDRPLFVKNDKETTGSEDEDKFENLEASSLKDEEAIETITIQKSSTKEKLKKKKNMEKKVQYKKILEENGCIQCPYCTKTFIKVNTFYRHKRECVYTYMCDLCGQQFSSSISLRTHHLFKHTDERKFKCALCDAAFKSKPGLADHMDMRHNTARNYICDRCSSTFKSKKTLQVHVRFVHSNLPEKFECGQCDKKFKKRSYLVTHEQLHTGHKLYSCDVCLKSFTTKASRDRHQSSHQTASETKPFQCHICFQVFKKGKYHRHHMRKYHPQDASEAILT